MRIGILTLHTGANYGGTLQCIALYNLLKNNGQIVDVIDFRPTIATSVFRKVLYRLTSIRGWGDVIKMVSPKGKLHSCNRELIEVFEKYRNEKLTYSEKCNELTIALVASKYDVIVVGSDQVWSSTVRSHLTYMADWRPSYKGRLFSYAACAVTLNYPFVRRRKIKYLLDKFETLSVRDEMSLQFVKSFLPARNIRIDLDPTLLYDFKAELSETFAEKGYILLYVLGSEISGGNTAAVSKIKSMIGERKVIAVTTYSVEIPYADVVINNAPPSDWLNYIKNADYVFTDSFHGMLFSIKFGIPFTAYYVEANRASRLVSLSELFRVEEMVVTEVDDIKVDWTKKTDFSIFDKRKDKSLSYIRTICQ